AARGARTVVIAGVPAGLLEDELLADILTIHFQRSRNNGGDVEQVTYPTRKAGVAYVTFEDAGDLVEEMKQQSPALSFGPLQRDGHIAVQGPFPALQVLRDFLLLKAKSLPEEDKRERKPHQRPRRKLQEHRGAAEMRNSTRNAQREKQVLVLDTDIYHYMKHFHAKALQRNDAVISGVTDGDITTVTIESAADAQGLKAKKMIENYSVELQKILRKERICFKEPTRAGRQRLRQLCERLKAHYPRVLIIPYDTHLDVVGTSADVLGFTEEVKRLSR
ncbi:hypothetical protein EK904_012621, partial [Melospiza melodia maxima]